MTYNEMLSLQASGVLRWPSHAQYQFMSDTNEETYPPAYRSFDAQRRSFVDRLEERQREERERRLREIQADIRNEQAQQAMPDAFAADYRRRAARELAIQQAHQRDMAMEIDRNAQPQAPRGTPAAWEFTIGEGGGGNYAIRLDDLTFASPGGYAVPNRAEVRVTCECCHQELGLVDVTWHPTRTDSTEVKPFCNTCVTSLNRDLGNTTKTRPAPPAVMYCACDDCKAVARCTCSVDRYYCEGCLPKHFTGHE